MRITAIEPQQKNPQRVNVYLEGEFAFGLARIVAVWLKVGQEISDGKIAELKAEDERELTYQKALHFISFRPRSSTEVRQNLTKRGIAEPLVEETVKRLGESGLLNDEAFARAWVENRNEFRPRSKSALRLELRRKGLNDETIQSVLDDQVDEEALALEAARKYARRLAGLDWPAFRQKLGGFLARRGFSYTTLAPVVSKVWKESQTADAGSTLDNEE
ncbi:MAG TPA: RecX family transcriptional regulator [Anaerolineales bacterium]|nr:RecX family transcriptional regulator [Anaerolineales bacterium]